MIDWAIKEIKPDIYLGVEDVWAFNGFHKKPWWKKINTIIHTTLDSLPIMPEAVETVKNTVHFYPWASFAEKALHEMGHSHVKTIHGSIETKPFYRKTQEEVKVLKEKFGLENNFVIGFVFRNQLRKDVPKTLEGFKMFSEKFPEAKAKLLLHTHWSEGWDIPRLIAEKKVDPANVLTTYFCRHCNEYDVAQFSGQNGTCRFCNTQGSRNTTNIRYGVSDIQLNDIYNLMDVYCHAFTSGGQEIPIQEAKLVERVTLVTNYSCGEDYCTQESGGLPLAWEEYKELSGTYFTKASTLARDVAAKLEMVYKMTPEVRDYMGKNARKFVLNNLSIEVVGKKFEQIFDSMPFVGWDYKFDEELKDPYALVSDNPDHTAWLIELYDTILKTKVDQSDDGLKGWLARLSSGESREKIINYFRKVAYTHNAGVKVRNFSAEFDPSDEGKRLAVIMPDGAEDVFMVTGLLPTIKETYPNHNIYFFTKPQHVEILDGNPYIHKTMHYFPRMDDPLFFEGRGDQKAIFDIAFPLHLGARNMSYMHNSKDILGLQIQK
jgi:glycosyltransferase involved in cell wall biosynthesis